MKYISLFSGIGGFEISINKIFSNSICLGYSEIDSAAIKVYSTHFPHHKNLGDIKNIDELVLKQLKTEKCNLLTAGFPCTNLTSLAVLRKDKSGLSGSSSGLFYELIRIISVLKPDNIIIENNNSMNKKNKKIKTEELKKIYNDRIRVNMIDASKFGVQTRKRMYWTTFDVDIKKIPVVAKQTWNDVLDPLSKVINYKISDKIIEYNNQYLIRKYKQTEKQSLYIKKTINNKNSETKKGLEKKEKIDTDCENKNIVDNLCYEYELGVKSDQRTRWDLGMTSDTIDDDVKNEFVKSYPVGKSRPVTTSGGNNNLLLDRRISCDKTKFLVRHFTENERECLFNLPKEWTGQIKNKSTRNKLLGNTVVVEVICFLMEELKISMIKNQLSELKI